MVRERYGMNPQCFGLHVEVGREVLPCRDDTGGKCGVALCLEQLLFYEAVRGNCVDQVLFKPFPESRAAGPGAAGHFVGGHSWRWLSLLCCDGSTSCRTGRAWFLLVL